MSSTFFLAVGFFAGTLAGITVMTLVAAGELKLRPAKVRAESGNGSRS